MSISGPFCSVDRLTLLLKVPKLCFSLEYLSESEINMRKEAIKQFHSLMLQKFNYLLNPDVNQGERTELYQKHYRFKNGVDLQICPRFPVRVRITDEGYIQAFGNGLDSERGYIDEYYDPDFSVRLEFNPNKNDIREISPFLIYLQKLVDLPPNEFIKVSRLDVAIDYPNEINPTLINARGIRKGFLAYDSDGIASIYFGSRESAYYFRIYDKKKELLHSNKISWSRYERLMQEYNFHKGQGDLDYKEPLKPEILNLPKHFWRFELEYKEPFFLGVFPEKIWHQFDRLNFYFGGQKTGDWKLDLILFVASQFHIKCVLSMLPKQSRIRYYEKLLPFLDKSISKPSDVFNRQFPAVWKTETEKILYAFGYIGDKLAI